MGSELILPLRQTPLIVVTKEISFVGKAARRECPDAFPPDYPVGSPSVF
jgi:hypothetical protein